MSLINKMLRDLSRRQHDKNDGLKGVTPAPAAPHLAGPTVLLLTLATIAIVGLITWGLFSVFWVEGTAPATSALRQPLSSQPAPTPTVVTTTNSLLAANTTTPAHVQSTSTPPPAAKHSAGGASGRHTGKVLHRPKDIQGARLVGAGSHLSGNGSVQLMFDRAVTWTVVNDTQPARVVLVVNGVSDDTVFPRKLQLPTAVTDVHADVANHALTLTFSLASGGHANTAPGTGPASLLNLYFGGVPGTTESVAATTSSTTVPASAAVPAATPANMGAAPAPPGAGGDAYTQALAALVQGNTAKGVVLLQQALSEDPDNADARESLAILEARIGTGDAAEQLLADGIKRGPGNRARLAMVYATVLNDRGATDDAISVLKANAPTVDSDPNYFALLASLEDRAGKVEDTARMYRELVSANPASGVWWMGLGMALEQSGQPGEARTAYAHALAAGNLSPASRQYVSERMKALQH